MTKHGVKKLKSGTELPLLDLRGKPYLQVAHRLVWFREEHPTWGVEARLVEFDKTHAVAEATITDETGRVIARDYKREEPAHFPDYMEKAITGSIGRALALCGYGTQFDPDLDEGHRIVDSPIPPASRPVVRQQEPALDQAALPGDYVCTVGKRYAGKTLSIIGLADAEQFAQWLIAESQKASKQLSPNAEEFVKAVQRFKEWTIAQREAMPESLKQNVVGS
jgi:hypothetical protein